MQARMMWRSALRLVAVALVALQTSSPVGPPPDPAPLVIEPSGCYAVLADGTCERPIAGGIRVWADTTEPVIVRRDNHEVPVSVVRLSGGSRIALDAVDAGNLEIWAGGRRGVLRLARPFVPPWAADAAAARARGDQGGARAIARPWLDDPEPAVRARATGIVARTELSLGNVSEAMRLLRLASEYAALAGRISDAVDDALALSYTLSHRAGRWTEAGQAIDRVEPLAARYADGRARVPYYRAIVASGLGDVRSAMRELRVARSRAEALGLGRLVWSVRNEWAISLERSGLSAEALSERTALIATEDPTIPACDRAAAIFNLGFGTLVRTQEKPGPCAETAPPGDPATWLRASLELSEARCPDAWRTAMGHVLMGDVALGAGRIEEATQELLRADMREASGPLRRYAMDLDARLSLARGDARGALVKYERLVALARATGKIDDERRALEGMGQTLERLGRLDAALDNLRAAEDLLVSASVLVPIGEAGAYQGTRETASRARVEILLSTGRIPEALAAGRAARARLLSSVASLERLAELPVEARERWVEAVQRFRAERQKLDAAGAHDWELATSELVRVKSERAESILRLRAALDDAIVALPRSNGELEAFGVNDDVSVFAMTLRQGGVVFVGDARGVRAPRIDLAPKAAHPDIARAILSAASPDVERARTVRVVTSADLACADVHAERLPNGVPLGLSARVTYGMDVRPTSREIVRPRRALVVADTRDDLPLARDEGTLVASTLAPTVDVVHLGGARASSIAVQDALSTATFFHYAGHADELNGELFLPLAGAGRLTTHDVLALPLSPERVVLSACQAGRVQPSGLALGMGLVQAFLEKGASEVLAPSRPVKDELALALARALVATPESTDFGAAIALLARTRATVDWSAYRIWRR
jgi:tetratricopeptide (TPR) repeat protein